MGIDVLFIQKCVKKIEAAFQETQTKPLAWFSTIKNLSQFKHTWPVENSIVINTYMGIG